MKRFLIYSLLISGFAACTADQDGMQEDFAIGQEIDFAAQVTQEAITRQNGEVKALKLPEGMHVTVIAPGYGTGAPDQKALYEPDWALEVTETPLNLKSSDKIKRSARSMVYTAWTAPAGVDMEAGTVDFATDLESFIGAHEDELNSPSKVMCLSFSHLVAKLSVSVFDVTQAEDPADASLVTNASISFPAIKQNGSVAATIASRPKVSPGKSGDALSVKLDGDPATVIFIPPLTPDELTMYGSFTVTVNSTNYVGTLANLNLASKSIAAGDHIKVRIEIYDDHTAVLQAITLAPWDEHDRNIYNRPSPGIWGVEDFAILAELWNTGKEKVEGYTLDNFCIGEGSEKTVILYTDLDMSSDRFTGPLGTEANPFSLNFDGNGYTIKGIDYTGLDNVGLFGVTRDAVIKNLRLENCRFEGNGNVGGVIGKADGNTSVDYCLVSGGSVNGKANIGGFAGYVDKNVVIRNVYLSIHSVGGASQVGGFAGNNLGFIGNSCGILSSGISGSTENAGGFAGKNTGTIENAFSQATFVITPSNGCGAWVGNNGADAKEGVNNRCYWNNTCIDNGYCTNIIGNNTNFNETTRIEILPSGTTGMKYDNGTGRFLNSSNERYSSLRQQLNTNITAATVLEKAEEYLPWAKVTDEVLPVFSY